MMDFSNHESPRIFTNVVHDETEDDGFFLAIAAVAGLASLAEGTE